MVHNFASFILPLESDRDTCFTWNSRATWRHRVLQKGKYNNFVRTRRVFIATEVEALLGWKVNFKEEAAAHGVLRLLQTPPTELSWETVTTVRKCSQSAPLRDRRTLTPLIAAKLYNTLKTPPRAGGWTNSSCLFSQPGAGLLCVQREPLLHSELLLLEVRGVTHRVACC